MSKEALNNVSAEPTDENPITGTENIEDGENILEFLEYEKDDNNPTR